MESSMAMGKEMDSLKTSTLDRIRCKLKDHWIKKNKGVGENKGA